MELGAVSVGNGLFFLLMDLFIFWLAFSKRNESPSQGAFSAFALSVVFLQAASILLIAFEQKIIGAPELFKYFWYFVAVTGSSTTVFFVGSWLDRMFSLGFSAKPLWLKTLGMMPLVLYVLMSLASFKTHWVFFLDEAGSYHRGSLFFLQLVIPYTYLAAMLVALFRARSKRKDFPKIVAAKFVLLYTVPPVVGSFIQVFISPVGNFSIIGISVGLLFCYVGMYLGDAEEHRRLKDLADYNEKLQLVNKQLRATMMKGELQAKTVADAIRGGFKISRFDDKFSFKYVSSQFAEMLGYTVEELMSPPYNDMSAIVCDENAPENLADVDQDTLNGKMYVMNYRVRCKDGSLKYVEDRGRLIKTEGSEDEVWSVVLDKDELVKVERALDEAEKSRKQFAEYNDIISKAGLGIWFVTLKSGQPGLMHGNEKLYELMGIPDNNLGDEDIHTFMFNRIVPEDLPIFIAAIDKMKKGQFAEALYRWRHPIRGIMYNRCGGTGVTLPDGSVLLSGYHGDATEIVTNEQKQQKLLADALAVAEESSRAKTAFLNNMSHDIRTPMNAILGFTALMEKECGNPEKIKEYLKKVKGAGDFLLSLINNVLEMARIESGKTELNELPTYLDDNTASMMNLFEADLKTRNLTLTSSLSVEHHYVYVDMVKVREIIINLISNAIKYSRLGGHIETSMTEIPCAREGFAAYEFVVKDDGIGMSESYLPHIFDSFVRERNSTESKIAGTGLGLPIVKKLVDLMGGTISVESTEGVGTKFTYVLEHRICSKDDVVREKSVAAADVRNMKGKRILLAEDNDLNAEIAETLLADAGFAVERAIDGSVCLDMVNKAPVGYYCAILMDIQMPCMDGYEATQKIRNLENDRKNIPIVAMTANAFDEDKRAAIDAGMNAHVAKPIDIDVLMNTLGGLLS